MHAMNASLRRLLEPMRPLARLLPERVKRPLRSWLAGTGHPRRACMDDPAYTARMEEERGTFDAQHDVHELPPIFHYWSNTWLRPEQEKFGFANPDEFFVKYLVEAHASRSKRTARFASIGCGNCDTEVRVARRLIEHGIRDFVIDCVDINETMLARGRKFALDAGVVAHIVATPGDFNDWQPRARYDAVIANQSLHHVLNLESLFDAIEGALATGGRLVTADMIGRNGHMRWPEAATIVQEFWQELPQAYRRNVQLRRREPMFLDWDCSIAGFEGIRAQDILPLLLQRFEFEFFFAYGNLIDPFIDRGFGPNFDAHATWDRDFIDRVHARDEVELLAGRITPTHMLAVLRRRPYRGACLHRPRLTPRACVRVPEQDIASPSRTQPFSARADT